MRSVAGVDGARRGWVVALPPAEVVLVERFADVVALADERDAVAVGVDMPIGLATTGARTSDRLARERLGPRRASLYPTPPRAALDAADYDSALAVARQATGKGLSKQAYHLLARSREVRAALTPADQPRFFEAHPETSFACLAGAPLATTKKTPEGAAERLALLRGPFPDLDATVPSGAAIDDVLDAWAAAWTALRVATGDAEWLGTGVDPDGYSLAMAV